MIQLELRGVEEIFDLLLEWERLLSSGEAFEPATLAAAEEFRRYAASISPVVTGAYQGAHVVIGQRMGAVMTIDPTAMNLVTGTPVCRYAGPVEEYHGVYQRTFDQAAGRAGAAGVEVILERLR